MALSAKTSKRQALPLCRSKFLLSFRIAKRLLCYINTKLKSWMLFMTKQYQKENCNLKNSSSPSARSNFACFLISLFLIATAYFTSAQAQASAASGGDTVNIPTSADLTAFRNRVNQGETSLDAVLLNNINLENAEWTPIYYNVP